jgi:hypothetical protein
MKVPESTFGFRKMRERRGGVSMNLRPLTCKASSGPTSDFPVHPGPNVTLFDEPAGGCVAAMCLPVNRGEDGTAMA